MDLLGERRKSGDAYPWEENAARRPNRGRKQYIPRLPQLAQTLQQAGALCLDRETHDSFRITNWKNKKALELEEINPRPVVAGSRLIGRDRLFLGEHFWRGVIHRGRRIPAP